MNLDINEFPSVTLDTITDTDIVENKSNETVDQIDQQEDLSKKNEDTEKSVSDNIEKVSDDVESADTVNVDNLTQAEAFVELLGTQGLQIYNEIPKGLTMEQFVKDIPEYISSIEQEIRKDEAAKLGKFQEYYELMVNGVAADDLKPAMMLESIVEMDLDAPNLTTSDLIEIVKTKHLLRGLSDSEATALANINAKNVEVLKEESISAQKYVSEYIESIKEDARNQKEQEHQQQKLQFEAEQKAFIEVLNQSTQYTKEQKKEFFDIRYKRDQQVSWMDESGNVQRDFVTKYDLLMHQIQTDPKKILDIIEYMNSGFDIKKAVKDDVANSYTKKLFEKLEGKSINNNNAQDKKEVSPVPKYNSVTF